LLGVSFKLVSWDLSGDVRVGRAVEHVGYVTSSAAGYCFTQVQ